MSGIRDALRSADGPHALSWPAFWVVLAVSIVGHLADAADLGAWQVVLVRIGVVALAVGAAFVAMLVLRRLLRADRGGRRSVARVLVIFTVGAATRGVVLGVGLQLVFGEPMRLGFRVIVAVTVMVPLLVIVAALVAAARAEAGQRAELEVVRARLREAETSAEEQITLAHTALTARIRAALEQAVHAGATSTTSDTAARLRACIDTVVRPISHELAGAVPHWSPDPRIAVPPTRRWRELWRDAPLMPSQPGAIAVMALVMMLPPALYRGGPVAGVITAGALAVSLVVMIALVDALAVPLMHRMRSAVARLALFALSIVLTMGVGGVVVLATLALAGDAGAAHGLAVAVVGIGVLVAVLIACVQALFASMRAVAADLSTAVLALDAAVARVHATAWQQQRMLALAIHGPLQAQIVAVALRVEQAAEAGADPVEVMDAAREQVLRALVEFDTTPMAGVDIRQDLANIAEAWQGVCEVEVHLDATLAARIDANPASAIVIVDVCTEACSNAVRHARASAIGIEIAEDAAGRIRLVVTSDGVPERRRPQGLGSRLLDEIAVEWERTLVAGRTSLDVRLPALAGSVPAAGGRPQLAATSSRRGSRRGARG